MSGAVDAHAICRSERLGDDVSLGPFAVVEPGAVLGDGAAVGSHAVIGAGAVVGTRASIGAGAIVAAGIEVGQDAVVRDGAVVLRPVPRATVVEGNPARICGYAGRGTSVPMDPVRQEVELAGEQASIVDTAVRGVKIHRLPAVRDLRGSLVAGELEGRLPFIARRFFIVHDVPGAEVRGEHAHYVCHQFLVCVSGQVHVIADDGETRQEFVLSDNRTGIYLPPMVWGTQYRYSPDCSLLVLASHPYDNDDYIRDYDAYLAELAVRRADG